MKRIEFEKNPQMLCPYCKKPLVPGKPKVYETFAEHVCDPNEENGPLPERETWVCGYKYCALYENSFWDWYGDFYTKLHHGLTRALAQSLGGPYKNNDSLYALNSHCLKDSKDSHSDAYDGTIIFHLGFWRWKLYISKQHNLMGEPVALGRIKLRKQTYECHRWVEKSTFWDGVSYYFRFLKDIKKIEKGERPSFGWKEIKLKEESFIEERIPGKKGKFLSLTKTSWKKEQHLRNETRLGYLLAYWLMNTFHSEWMEAKK